MRKGTLALAAVISLALVSCGGDDDEGTTTATSPAQPVQVGVTVTASSDGKTIKMDVPSTLRPGATEFVLANSTKEPTEMQFVVLTEGHTLKEFLPLIEDEGGAPIPPWVTTGGGVGSVNPGQSRNAIVTLKPGTYSYFSSTSPDTPNATEQYKRGAMGTFEVAGEDTGAVAPSETVTMSIQDYSFTPTGLKAGQNKVSVKNDGKQLHHWAMVKITKEDAKFDDVVKYLQTENPKGEPPVDFKSFSNTAVYDTQTSQVETIKLEAGRYAFLCFISDRAGGPPHAIKYNMINEATIAA